MRSEYAPLPDTHHFARQCSGKDGKHFSHEDDDYHQPPWLNGDAFAPTARNPEISGLWLERVPPDDREIQIQRLRAELLNSRRKIKATEHLAIVGVADLIALGKRYDRRLHVYYTPDYEQRLPSHSEISGIQPEDHILQQKIADTASITLIRPSE